MDILSLLRREQERRGGSLPLREWMRLALYDPDFGYYALNIAGVGAGGDFSTAPSKFPILARAVRAWFEELGKREALRVPLTEIGAGGGHFAREFRKRFVFPLPVQIVEISPALAAMQKRMLRGGRVRWFSSPGEVLAASGGNAVFFGNELVDAFPCSVFEKCGDGWREVAVRLVEDNSLHEVLLEPVSALPHGSLLNEKAGSLPAGARVETHETFHDWLLQWVPAARDVHLLLIDYARRGRVPLQGTLRAYWKQQRLEGSAVYSRFGRQDLTADVFFPDVIRWAEETGAELLLHESLARFMMRFLPASGPDTRRTEESRLFDESDAGGAFEVVHLRWGGFGNSRC